MQHREQRKGQWRAILAVVAVLPFQTVVAQTNGALESAAEVVVRALGLVDVPYRYGGRTPTGFDCSGFVGYVYSESVGLTLPRRAEDIGRVGESHGRGDLTPGDLVFFNTLGRRFSHVGIYVGDGQFVHAPARRGRVRIDRLTDPYWLARYNGARRLEALAAPQVAATIASPALGAAADSTVDLRVTP